MKQWLDRVTGSVTMYKLVLIVLVVIQVLALLLSLFGQSAYSFLALLASAVVAIGVTLVTSLLAAKIMRVTPHSDSAYITGLLLFFVMEPKLDPLGLTGIAIAALVASVSKYLIAARGRHIFNPAAFGAFVPTMIVFTTLIGMSYASWWVGTPLLQPAVFLGAFLVLYRTKRLTVGVSFILLALVLATTVAIVQGQAPIDALRQALLQSPIVFFAGFMLSEPLTLPPRRWQQLVEVVVVAFIFAVPLPTGPVSNSPVFALLVGNLLAFAFGQRRGIRLSYLGKKQIGPTTWELSFEPDRPVRFAPGQYMELTIPHRKADFRGSRRYFSISSPPGEDGPVTFALTMPAKSSSFKKALLDLEPGTLVHGTSVGGDFALPRDVDEPLLLVAGGIGITPFASQLADAVAKGHKRDAVVFYSMSSPGQLPYADLLEKTGTRVVLVAPEAPARLPAGWEYAGPGRITGDLIKARVPDVAQRQAFVSGPPGLVNDIRVALRKLGARKVHSDYFSGY